MINQYFAVCLVAVAVSSVVALPDIDGRIVGGMAINVKQAPYIVRLLSGNEYCGGSLVASNYVVTAAHCIRGKAMDSLTVVANVTSVYEEGIRRKVVRMEMHPEYSKDTMYSDIAVLQLNEPIYGLRTLPLCEQPLKENDVVQVSGWGRLSENSSGSTTLQTVFLPVRSKALCDKEYYRFVKQNMFCASGIDPISACRGDSGGPAVFNGQLCGTVAFSWNCGQVGSSEVYTHVYSVKPFIENFMFLNWA